jgi:hypothetical protein
MREQFAVAGTLQSVITDWLLHQYFKELTDWLLHQYFKELLMQ